MKKRGLFCLFIVMGLVMLVLAGPVWVTRTRFEQRDETAQWISKDPEMWFSWKADQGYRGELTVNGKIIPIAMGFLTSLDGVDIWCLEETHLPDNYLLGGRCSFGWNKFYIKVTSDKTNLFGGELPTFAFTYQEDKGTVLLSSGGT